MGLDEKIKSILKSVKKVPYAAGIAVLAAVAGLSPPYAGNASAEEKKGGQNSLWGPSKPLEWNLNLSREQEPESSTDSAVIYSENHRGKVFVASAERNNKRGDNNSGKFGLGARLFPLGDVMELKMAVKHEYDDKTRESQDDYGMYITGRTHISGHYMKLRYGHERANAFSGNADRSDFINFRANIIDGMANRGRIDSKGDTISGGMDILASASYIKQGDKHKARYGAGVIGYVTGNILFRKHKIPLNIYYSFAATADTSETDNVTKSISFGRYASLRGENYPIAYFNYRGDKNKDLYLAAFMFGKPILNKYAAVGMTEGLFHSTVALPELRDLRRFNEFNMVADDWDVAGFSIFYANFKTKIDGTSLKAGGEQADIYWTLPIEALKSWRPGIHIQLARETSPDFRTMSQDSEEWIGFGTAFTVMDTVDCLFFHIPKKEYYSFGINVMF